jgi:hypothetical protein
MWGWSYNHCSEEYDEFHHVSELQMRDIHMVNNKHIGAGIVRQVVCRNIGHILTFPKIQRANNAWPS